MTNGTGKIGSFALLLLLNGALLVTEGLPTDLVTHAPPEDLIVEARAQKQDVEALDVDEDLDGRSAYVNNQFVPSEPIEMIDDEQNAPLYEILQKQMEQVLAATGPDVPIYEDDKSKRQRNEQLPNKPLFSNNNNEAEADEDYVDEALPTEMQQGYVDAEKPDATVVEEQIPDAGYQMQQQTTSKPIESTTMKPPSSVSSTTAFTTTRSRPQRRRSTTAIPRTTRSRINSLPKVTATTPSSMNHTELTTPINAASHKPRPNSNSSSKPNPTASPNNNLPHDPQIYQHKRRIIFKTISTGSQFVNSPIGDLMIKFSIGFAKPAQGAATPTSEVLRAFSNNLMRNIELQKLRRIKVQKD